MNDKEEDFAGDNVAPHDDTRNVPRAPVPLTIITGFLGSGKTTVLNNLLHNKINLKIAVVVNEFGSINIDGDIVESAMLGGASRGGQGARATLAPMEMLFLSNGCVCCSASTDLQASLTALMTKAGGSIDCLVLETSGVTDPVPLVDVLMLPALQALVSLHNVVTVVDAEVLGTLEPGSETLARYLRQLSVADLVLLNKADLVTGVQLRNAEANIHSIMKHGRAVAVAKGADTLNPREGSQVSPLEASGGALKAAAVATGACHAPPPVLSCRFGQVPLAVILGVDRTLDYLSDDVTEPSGIYPALGVPGPGRVWRTTSLSCGESAELAARESSDGAQEPLEGAANGHHHHGQHGEDCDGCQHGEGDGHPHGSCCEHGGGQGSTCDHAHGARVVDGGASGQGRLGPGRKGEAGDGGSLTYSSSSSGSHRTIMAISITCERPFALARLQQFFVAHVTPKVLRMKGFFLLDAPGTRRYLLQMAGRRRFTFKEDDWPTGAIPTTKFVILGVSLDVERLVSCLRACVVDLPATPLYREPVAETERSASWEYLTTCVARDGRFDPEVNALEEEGIAPAEQENGGHRRRFLFRLLGSKFHELPSDTVNTMLLSQINTGGRIFVSQACSAVGEICVRLDISCMSLDEVCIAWHEVESNASTVLSKLFFEIFCCSPFA